MEARGLRHSKMFSLSCVKSEATLEDLDLLSASLWTKKRDTTEKKYANQTLTDVAFVC